MALYAGFDCSTQSLTVVVIDSHTRAVVYKDSEPFAEPFIRSPDPLIVHASPAMWRSALETVLGRMARSINRRALRAISGSAQQHGSVYCGDSPEELIRRTSPIWMDASTGRECEEIEAALGGAHAVARLTGSRCYPRFTGPQIRKFARDSPDAFGGTVRIHLVSSWMASLLVGAHGAVDHGDASGMNLMDIRTRVWAGSAVDATAPGLEAKLPPLIPSSASVGALAARWCDRFDLPPANVIVWSGDNLCSLVGVGLFEEGQLAVSLGTSDTIFGPMADPRVSSNLTGHTFVSPTGEYMGITVFRNGALARERVRQQFGLAWPDFSRALRETPAGNDGAMMLPWFEPEITPHAPMSGVRTWNLERTPPARHVRAIVEAQAMALARHSEWMGVRPNTIHATGGAAENREILQVIADVFDARVLRFESTDSAALGAALRALQADAGEPWREVAQAFVTPVGDTVLPIPAHVDVYRALRPLYSEREAATLGSQQR